MTDVRLTALNPVDSQVYPVACNTSGELLVADGGPDLTVTGDLTVDGSSTFADGNITLNKVTNGSNLNLRNDASTAEGVIEVYKGGFTASDRTVLIDNDGTATFEGDVIAERQQAAGTVALRLTNTQAADINASVSIEAKQQTRSGGSIVFGRENGFNWNTYTYADGYISFRPVRNGTPVQALKLDSNGNAEFAATGTFVGNVTAPNITSLNELVNKLHTQMSLILRQIDISAETP
tara:strand:+ start:3090 stop:3797 length:708 start_codon:yes stop_codon:yes gene_type:complete